MNFVNWIKSVAKIEQIKSILKWEWKIKYLVLFHLWITTALRIWDLLKLKISDIFFEDWKIRDNFEIKDNKTWKRNSLLISKNIKKSLSLYVEKYPYVIKNQDNYLFFNEKKAPVWNLWIWRVQAYKFISKICKDVWLEWKFWTHTMRKTFWAVHRLKWTPLELISHKLNHSSLSITKKYLWISDDEVNLLIDKIDL